VKALGKKVGASITRLLPALIIGACAACDSSSLSGKYGGNDCAYELTFKGKDTVYVQILGMTEVAGQYRVDGDKVVVSGPGWPGAVFTRNGNALESVLMGHAMVCKKE
jgi:hypothetical protein